MNKNECKKYIRKSYEKLINQSLTMNPENLANEMEKVIKNESRIYIAYAKLAMHHLNKSATDITAKQLLAQIDVISKIYDQTDILLKAENI